jgi:hypothetical protein
MDQWRAARLGRLDLLGDILAEKGANPSRTRWSGATALHSAAAEGHADCCELLLEKGADVNERCAWGWYSPLHLALRRGHREVAVLLLNHGARWEMKDKHGKTPMHWAVAAGKSVAANEVEKHARRLAKEARARQKAAEAAALAERNRLAAESRARQLQEAEAAAARAAAERAALELEAAECAADAAAVAWEAVFDARVAVEAAERAVDHAVHLKGAKNPAFYERLQQELTEEEFQELLHCTPKMAANFGLSKMQFKELKKTAKVHGLL